MRTSLHHQSEAQPPNGPLTAATSPDTPSTCPATQSGLHRYVREGLRNPRELGPFLVLGSASVCRIGRRKRHFGTLSPRTIFGISFFPPGRPLNHDGASSYFISSGFGNAGPNRTHAVPRGLPQFETSGISQPFWPRARQRNCTPIHHRDLRGLRDKWSRGCEKSDDRIVGGRLTSSSRPRDGTCEQFFGRYLSPAPVNLQNRTRLVATPMLSSVWRLGVSQGTAHKCRILRTPRRNYLRPPRISRRQA